MSVQNDKNISRLKKEAQITWQVHQLLDAMKEMDDEEVDRLHGNVMNFVKKYAKKRNRFIPYSSIERVTYAKKSDKRIPSAPNNNSNASILEKKKSSVTNILAQMSDKARELRKTNTIFSNKDRIEDKKDLSKSLSDQNEPGQVVRTASHNDQRSREEIFLHHTQAALNKVLWSNYENIMTEIASQVDAMYFDGLLNDDVCSALVEMFSKQVIHTEIYAIIWTSLTAVYPCLVEAEKKVLDTYLDIYEYDFVSHSSLSADNSGMKKQREGLTSFLLFTMKHSSSSMTRVEMTEKFEFLVTRLATLCSMNKLEGQELEIVVDDILVFVRNGWEILYREEIWPLSIETMELLKSSMKKQKGTGKFPNSRLYFQLEDTLKDIVDQGRHHTSG